MTEKPNPREQLEPWQRDIPSPLAPPEDSIFLRTTVNLKLAFLDDDASRWMLGLLAARNDLGVSMKILGTYLVSPKPANETRLIYNESHSLYFWRLMMSQIYEAWTTFSRGAGAVEPIIKIVCSNEDVKATWVEISRTLGELGEDGNHTGKFLERCRATTFHYYDDKGDGWADQLEAAAMQGTPFFIVPKSSRTADTRYIVADEWILSRLNAAGFAVGDLHSKRLLPVASAMLKLIDKCSLAYLHARGVTGTVDEVRSDALELNANG